VDGDTGRPLAVLDISVLGAGAHVWLSAHSDQGSVFGIPRHLPDMASFGLTSSPVDWLAGAVRHARAEAGEQALAVGRALSDLVFGVPDVAALLQQARGAAGSTGAQLLVRLLAAPQDVSAWPWELLVDPQRPDRFLTLARDVHVVRSGRSRTYPVRQSPIQPPLNLLLVMSSPLSFGPAEEETPFDLYEEKRSLLRELQPLVDRGLLYVEVEDRPTIERLRSRIGAQRRGFHLFHYLGHAQPAGLKLEQRNGRGRLVPSQDFATLLQQMPDLRLAVFAGCETARAPADPDPEAWPGQLSAADYCVRDACPMVVGMQAVLPFGTERLFTRFFYQALTGGQPVAEALRLARLAIADDEFAGGSLVNWAVPCLFVGGSLPGPVTNPAAKAEPPTRHRRVALRLGVRQGDLRFISRLSELREAVDALCGRNSVRLLHVIGLPSTGKTAFLDRTLEELDSTVVQLFVNASRLLDAADPVGQLCELVAEVVKYSGRRPAPRNRLDSGNWWERLLETLDDVPLALVIDDGDLLCSGEPGGDTVLSALGKLTKRRSRARLAVAANEELATLTAPLTANELRRIQLQALSWTEVWQWIRRNLPVLTRYGEAALAPFYHDLPHLEQWEQLAGAVAGDALTATDLPHVVERLAARVVAGAPVTQPPPVFGDAPTDSTTERPSPRGPLRVAIAGPGTEGHEAEYSRAVTSFAVAHGVSGRVLAGEVRDATSSLAELVLLPTPLSDDVDATNRIPAWAARVEASQPDLIVLNFWGPQRLPQVAEVLERNTRRGRLVIVAGGISTEPGYPACLPDVLTIGALGNDGGGVGDSPYLADLGKPELYAPANVQGSPASATPAQPGMEKTSMAALYTAAAAIAVWASDRGLSGTDIRWLLIDTATSFTTRDGFAARRLDVAAALARTRRQLIIDTLQWGALQLGQLLAETGLRPEIAVPLLDSMVDESVLMKVVQGGVERFEDPNALYLEYARLRLQQSGWERTQLLQLLVDRARQLAKRGRYSAAKVQELWISGHDGRRVVALAIMQAAPGLGTIELVSEAITSSRSAFEQYQGLVAAREMADLLTAADAEHLLRLVQGARSNGVIHDDGDRAAIADQVVARLHRVISSADAGGGGVTTRPRRPANGGDKDGAARDTVTPRGGFGT
jgi:hypothetical protein